MTPPEWTEREVAFFVRDGALRDIYVTDITPETWSLICHRIVEVASDLEFSVDGAPAQTPGDWAEALRLRETMSPLLTARVGPVHIAIHFFDEREFECDFWPTDVTTKSDFHGLCQFMEILADASGRDVLLTDENFRERPFLVYRQCKGEFDCLPWPWSTTIEGEQIADGNRP